MDKTLSLADIAEIVSGELRGDAEYKVSSIRSLEDASAGDLSFLSSKAYRKHLASSQAGAVMLKEDDASSFGGNVIIVADPYCAYAKASQLFNTRASRKTGIHPSAVVSESASIGEGVSIGANSIIGDNVTIGDDCEIYPGVVISEDSQLGNECLIYANVTIYHSVRIGNNVTIHSSTVIGADGFGFAPTSEGWTKIYQNGSVVIGNNVEIGASTTIDRGAIEDTIIHDGVIIDNQVQIAHNVSIGGGSAIAGCVGIAGSTNIGKNCIFGGAVGVAGHINIADGSTFLGGTVVTKNTKNAGVYASSTPLQDAQQWRKNSVRFRQLDDMAERLKKLEKEHKVKD